MKRTFSQAGAAALLLLALALTMTGCGTESGAEADTGAESQAPPEQKQPTALSVQQVLEQLTKTYQDASSYEDGGGIYFTFVQGHQEFTEGPVPFSVALARPNRLRLQMFQAAIVSDGSKLLAATSDIPGQVLEVKAPSHLTPENFAPSDILQHAMTGGLPSFVSPQIELLVGAGIRGAGSSPKLLDEQKIDDRTCYRVELTTPDGPNVLWIDKETFVLHRVDLPSEPIKAALDPENQLQRMSVRLELKGARLDPQLEDKVFQFDIPQGAARVKHFVPPISEPPQRVGETLSAFEFVDLEGNAVTSESLQGKICVIDFWFTTCPPCQMSMPHLQEVYEKYKDNDQVRFMAASIDPESVPNEDVEQTLRGWGAEIPIVRDAKGQGQSVFEIPGAPTLFLIDGKGKIHGYQVGVPPTYATLDERIEMLLAGKDVAQQVLDNYEAERQAYELELQKASATGADQLIEVPRAEIAPKSEPQLLSMSELWRSTEVKEPGNVLVIEEEGAAPRIFVLDGWRAVVELDTTGKVVNRHELPIAQRTGVSFLRTAVDSEGKRYFVAAAVSQQQLHLFDDQWELLLSFPEGKHAGIADVQLGDLDGSGQLAMLVGYWGDVGVQGVGLDGKRLWANRSMQNVMQLALADPNEADARTLLCVNSRGTLVPVDGQGEQGTDIRINNRALTNLVIADLDGDGTSEWCALAADPNRLGTFVAVGVSPQGEELWSYDLPEGLHKYLIERIVPGQLAPGDGGWLLPAADGSIHILTKGGQVVDRFNYGEALTGLALTSIDDNPVLLVSTPDGLVAWQLGRRNP